jgi:hypothetical protein
MAHRSVYSHYLPLKRYARATSRAASLNKDPARSPTKEKETRNRRAASANHNSKRRSTLNSREAGYDEAEALRRAIEASKEDAAPDLSAGANRRPKRGRSDSQELVVPPRRPCCSMINILPGSRKTRSAKRRVLDQHLRCRTRTPKTRTRPGQLAGTERPRRNRGWQQPREIKGSRRSRRRRSVSGSGSRQQTSERVEPTGGGLMV